MNRTMEKQSMRRFYKTVSSHLLFNRKMGLYEIECLCPSIQLHVYEWMQWGVARGWFKESGREPCYTLSRTLADMSAENIVLLIDNYYEQHR